jgi:glyoxylase-like metal-dependent hydrolase (beta-lactamase superfamily II)
MRPDLRVHLAAAEAKFWASPDFSHTSMPPGFPDALRSAAKRFLNEYHNQLRPFEAESEVAPGVLVRRTGGHTPGHSVVRLERRTILGTRAMCRRTLRRSQRHPRPLPGGERSGVAHIFRPML